MTQLRWVLLGLGVALIIGVYLFSRGLPQRWVAPLKRLSVASRARKARVEPGIGTDQPDAVHASDSAEAPEKDYGLPEDDVAAEPAPAPERVVTIRFIPDGREIASDRVILALRAAGLKHGKYGIFHKHESELSDEPLFSVASLTEPGTFDLTRLAETKIAGTSFFMVLPGPGDPVERFDQMVATARELARELDGELRDEKGSSWSIQRERYVREEIIEYRHMFDIRRPG